MNLTKLGIKLYLYFIQLILKLRLNYSSIHNLLKLINVLNYWRNFF